jgi:hypothetical protein
MQMPEDSGAALIWTVIFGVIEGLVGVGIWYVQ